MYREVSEIPEVVQRQVEASLPAYVDCGRRLAALAPPAILTCARGTSDQAASYFKYLIEMRCGVPVASMGPSVASIYGRPIRANGLASLTISQSGASPDIVKLQEVLRNGGAYAVALVNAVGSPVGSGADEVLPIRAGPERAVAATKSLVASLTAAAAIVAGFSGDDAMIDGLRRLPQALQKALSGSGAQLTGPVGRMCSIYTISRGVGLAAAGEAALKFKETCRIHAESYSAAEVLHGPVTLSDANFGAVAFIPEDDGAGSVREVVEAMRTHGAVVFTVGQTKDCLALEAAPHPFLTPILQITAFYLLLERFAVSIGQDPDNPPRLTKVTETH